MESRVSNETSDIARTWQSNVTYSTHVKKTFQSLDQIQDTFLLERMLYVLVLTDNPSLCPSFHQVQSKSEMKKENFSVSFYYSFSPFDSPEKINAGVYEPNKQFYVSTIWRHGRQRNALAVFWFEQQMCIAKVQYIILFKCFSLISNLWYHRTHTHIIQRKWAGRTHLNYKTKWTKVSCWYW